jgi:hypothetical protein
LATPRLPGILCFARRERKRAEACSWCMNVTIAPISTDFLRRARAEGLDDQGQPVKHVIAEGGEPCRDVLRRARPNERLILASFTPFSKPGPYKEYGPVFILADGSDEEARRDAMPLDGYLRERFVIRAYSDAEEILDAELVTPDEAAPTIARFFDRADTAFLHVRFPTYGCFAMRIDRA